MSAQTKGHPKGLYTLFATEMWERFSYYGMRALLVLYLTAELVRDGFGLERHDALAIYAVFTGLVYLTPILGGWVSDKFLGKRKTVYIGGVVMAIGQFLLATSAFTAHSIDPALRQFIFNFGLGTLIIGNGFFKPNISTIVGDFYDDNDPRKDSAFNIFYMGINLGAILGPFIAGGLGENIHWGWGFFSAGVGMVIGVLWLYFREETLDGHGLPPNSLTDKVRLDGKDWRDIILYSVGLVAGTLAIILFWRAIPEGVQSAIVNIGFVAIALGLAWVIIRGIDGDNWVPKFGIVAAIVVLVELLSYFWDSIPEQVTSYVGYAAVAGLIVLLVSLMRSSNDDWSRMGVIITLAIFNVAFWAGFEQAGGTMNLFAAENTNRMIGGWEVPASWFQNINPFAILVFAPLFSVMWLKLDARGLNPRTPIKFALGLLLGALAFWVMSQAANKAADGTLVSPMWLVVVYVILTLGELCLSPIGLSMITKLAPPKLVSVVMGLWMASFAAGNYLAGILENILHKYDFALYPFITMVMLISAGLLLLMSPILNKAMKGIH